MSLESTIAGLVAAANKLTDAVSSKIAAIDKSVSDARATFEAFKLAARDEYPSTNALPNASFFVDTNADGMPDNWGFSSNNYRDEAQGASTLSASRLEPLTAYQAEITKLNKNLNVTAFNFLNALRLTVVGHPAIATWARLQAALPQPFAGTYSGGCFMYIVNPGAVITAGIGGGNYYATEGTTYDLARGGWQWVSAPRRIVSYLKAHGINFQMKAGMTTDIIIAVPVAVDGYIDRPII